MTRWIITLVALSVTLCGCSSRNISLAVFENVKSVREFPCSSTLENGEDLNFVPAGALDIAIIGDTIIFSVPSEKFIYAYDIADGTCLGSFLRKGNGPYEFLNPPFMQDLVISDGIVGIYDPEGHFYDFDLEQSINQSVPKVIKDIEKLPRELKSCFRIDDSSYYCRRLRSDEKGQQRFLWSGEKETYNSSIEALNEILLEGKGDGYRHNLLSSIAAYDKKKDIVVEVSMYQDVINIYSLRKEFELSIVTGDNINTIEELSTLPYGDFKDVYMDLRLYDDCFVCLRAGNCLQFFDWCGTPLKQWLLPESATAFDVDRDNGFLFTYDIETERLLRYSL